MECSLGIAFYDFVLLAADTTHINNLFIMKTDEEKIVKLTENLVMAVSGESGDTAQFSEFIGKNIKLYSIRNGYELSPQAGAHYTRHNLAQYLRSQTPYNVSLMLAGYTPDEGSSLFLFDYLASMVKVPYATTGYGGLITTSIIDRYYKPDATEEQGYEILVKCVTEIHKRLVLNLPKFKVVIVDANGIRDLPNICGTGYEL